ncbi:MAG TPA: CehA/McbA family metallohydrolase [Coriobacteriia bacterium]|nr:CehA/McbA family metallohydrolase [Coriobacteriia bacterium]
MSDVWSRADLHVHSTYSDGLATIPEILRYARDKTDMSVIAITDHNTIEGALLARSMADDFEIDVVVGEEVSTASGHVIGLFIEEHIPAGMSVAQTIAAIDEQGGIAMIPHPFSAQGIFGPFGVKGFGAALNELAFHALEVYNSMPLLIYANRVAARVFAGGQGIAATGGSDAHVLQGIGKGYTVFRGTTASDLRASIDGLETRAETSRGGLGIALRYACQFSRIQRQREWNRDLCKPHLAR